MVIAGSVSPSAATTVAGYWHFLKSPVLMLMPVYVMPHTSVPSTGVLNITGAAVHVCLLHVTLAKFDIDIFQIADADIRTGLLLAVLVVPVKVLLGTADVDFRLVLTPVPVTFRCSFISKVVVPY